MDGDLRRGADDHAEGGIVQVNRLGTTDDVLERYSAITDLAGSWQVRALPDGRYRVMWDPPVPPELLSKTIPPAEPVALTSIETVYRVTVIVEIMGASRILDIDFGIPPQQPVPGAVGASTPVPRPPSTPTPALPEEGGPPGGVVGGYAYVDNDGSRSRTEGDGVSGGTILVNLINSEGNLTGERAGQSDTAGHWEVRGLPDGEYRVIWAPPVPPELYSQTIPPVESIVLNPLQTIQVITRTVSISGANRILDIDFGIPPQPPVPGAGGALRLPSTGKGNGDNGWFAPLSIGVALVLLSGLGLAVLRRRGSGTS